MHIRSLLCERIEAAFSRLGLEGHALLQAASRPEFGDYQANGVMAAAKRAGRNPQEVAQQVIDALDLTDIAQDLSIAGPGFINITLAPQFIAQQARHQDTAPNVTAWWSIIRGRTWQKKCTSATCAAPLSVTALPECWRPLATK